MVSVKDDPSAPRRLELVRTFSSTQSGNREDIYVVFQIVTCIGVQVFGPHFTFWWAFWGRKQFLLASRGIPRSHRRFRKDFFLGLSLIVSLLLSTSTQRATESWATSNIPIRVYIPPDPYLSKLARHFETDVGTAFFFWTLNLKSVSTIGPFQKFRYG